jgi:hypothetical protein
MQIPDFHFEFVKQCVYLVLQRMKDADRDAIAKLVADMVVKSNLLSARSLEVGLRVAGSLVFWRLYVERRVTFIVRSR